MLLFCDRVGIALEFDFRRGEHTGIADFGQIRRAVWNSLQNRVANPQLAE
jgi:hypothetical protein